jgi:diguanylate cyclase (GGDEF)-like protein/PAS domain S-box-containing protein
LDIGLDPALWEAMKRARESGRLTATPPTATAAEIFLLAPVYFYNLPHDTTEQRGRNLEGFIRGAFAPGPLINLVFRGVKSPRGLDIYFFRQGAGPDEPPFHVRSSLLRTAPAEARPRADLEAGLHWTGEIALADTRWTMIVVPIPRGSPLVNHENSLTILAVGLLLTMAAMSYVELSRRHKSQLDALMIELGASEKKFRLLFENARDAIVMADAEGKMRFWNPAAERIFGYASGEILGRSMHEILAPERYRDKAVAGYAYFAKTGTGDVLSKTLELAALRKDGSEFPIELSVSGFLVGGAWHAIALARDVTERNRLMAATEYQSKLLHAASVAAMELQTSRAIEEAMAKVLQTIGEAVRVQRVLVFENNTSSGGTHVLALQYRWHSTDAPAIVDAAALANAPELFADPWFAPLREGQAVSALPRTMMDGAAKALFTCLRIHSILIVPVSLDGKYWGHIGLDDCKKEREWTSIEADILRTVANMIGSAITRERYVEQLRDANTIIESSPTILYRFRGEPTLPLTYVSHNITLFGYDPADLIASPELYKTYIHPDDKVRVLESLSQTAMEGRPVLVEFRLRRSDGAYRWVEGHHTPIRDAAGRLVEIEGVLTDVTEKKEAAERIYVLARTDALTGLANRATFIDRLRQTFAAARRGANPFAVLYLDVDRFKDVNDTLGHFAGDLLLKAVAERLKSCTRETDLVARLGGDEFGILQTELIDLANAATLAAKVHDVLAAPYQLGDSEMHISASIGISPYMIETAGSDEMLAQADLALYRAKEEGRDQYCFHSADLDREVRDRVTLANDLRQALERDELELYYQPQVELATGRIVGMEALIRWNHPRRGVLRPGEFLPIAEKTVLMVTLGQWVLDHACEQMSAWREAGIAPAILAINLSLAQLRTGDEFVGSFTQTVMKWGLGPRDLELDVTEAMLAHVTMHKNNVLDRLQQLGVKIAIDDFGTQYSSLDYLKTFRVSRLKIPRPMIDAATQDPSALAMVRAIIGVARELDIDVIAQGVETEAQRALLTCAPSTTKVQGYYYCAPVRAGRATDMLRQRLIEPRLSQVSGAV